MKRELNKEICSLKGSASIDLMKKARQLKQENRYVCDMSGGEPDFDTPPKICEAARDAMVQGLTHYAVGKGDELLRTKIAEKLYKDQHICCDREQILVTPGGKYAIYLAIRTMINQGDEVLCLDPSWLSYAPIVRASGGIPVHVELSYSDGYEISEKKLLEKLSSKTKAIIINYPNNPSGRVLRADEVELLLNFVNKYDLYLISDEVYEKIVYPPFKHISPASGLKKWENVIIVHSFSKAYAMTGWRIGYMAASHEFIDLCYKLFAHTITGVSPFVQKAAIKALECEAEVETMLSIYAKRRQYFISEINSIDGLSCRFPEGGFYAWVKVDYKDMTARQFAEYILEQGNILAVPGDEYGENCQNFLRFSFATSMETLHECIDILKKIMCR